MCATFRHKVHGGGFVAIACYLVAALSVGELLPSAHHESFTRGLSLSAAGKESQSEAKRPWEEHDNDIDAYVWLCGAYSHARHPVSFCRSYNLNSTRLAEVGALAAQLAQLLRPLLGRATDKQQNAYAGTTGGDTKAADEEDDVEDELNALRAPLRLKIPTPEATRCLHQCVIHGLIDHVAVWQDPPRLPPDATPAQRAANRGGYRCAELKGQLALLHPSSNLLHMS